MSVAVCRGPTMPSFEAPCWLKKPADQPPYKPAEAAVQQRPAARVDIWNAIQADVDAKKQQQSSPPKPYVHPLVRRSSSLLMSQKSLEVCTESLGNETGSGDFTASLDMAGLFDRSPLPAEAEESFWEREFEEEEEEEEEDCERKTGLAAVNYHRCSSSVTRRAFPPPLPSMSRRDGPCLQMRPRREDGRLVVEAVPVRPRGYLHARRHNGRLCLSFVECSAREQSPTPTEGNSKVAAAEAPFFPAVEPRNEQGEEEEVEMEEEEEEEVEVVDRGTVVEVKVSTQPQTLAAGKVHRSRLVINKFVGGTPLTAADQLPRCHSHSEAASDEEEGEEAVVSPKPTTTLRRVPSSTTTLAAAVAVASTGTDHEPAPEGDDERDDVSASAAAEPKQLLLFTSRRGDKQDLLQSVRRCRQLRQKPLFILEPYCIATS